MVNDPEEKVNQINNPEYAGRIREMAARVKKYIEDGRSTPGAKAANDGGNSWKQITDIMPEPPSGSDQKTSVFRNRMRRFSIGGNELARDMLEDTDEQADALLLLNYKR